MVTRFGWLVVTALVGVGCQCGVGVTADGGSGGGAATGGGSASGGGNATGGGSANLDGGLSDFCASNAPVPVQVGNSVECTGDLGKRVFRFGFCSCTDVSATNAFVIDGVAGSRDGGGSAGINGSFTSSNTTTIGGTLWTQGATSSSNQLSAGRDLFCGSASLTRGSIARDVRSEGNVSSVNGVSVGGTLTLPASAMVNNVTAAGGVVRQAVTVGAPCDCSAPADIGGIVDFFQTVADNTARGVSPMALVNSQPVTLALECGRYFFPQVNAQNGVTITTQGRVVIAIDGDVNTSNTFSIVPGPGSQVDLFIAGNLTFSNSVTLGDATRPWATRVYVGGTTVSSSNVLDVAANLYAPNATFTASNRVDVKGAVFVRALSSSNTFHVGYDEGILNLDGCAAADAGCATSRDCVNPTPACVMGSCTTCARDSDCAGPLLCDPTTGLCVEGTIN